jgi:hypothetical protein
MGEEVPHEELHFRLREALNVDESNLMMIKMTVMIQKALSTSEVEMEDSETDVSDECNTDDEKKHD